MRFLRSLGIVLGLLAATVATAPAARAQAPAPADGTHTLSPRARYELHLDSLEATAPTLVGKLAILRAEMGRIEATESRLTARLDSLGRIGVYLDAIGRDTTAHALVHGAAFVPTELSIRHSEFGATRAMMHAATTEPPNTPLAPRHALGGYTFLALIGAGTQLGRLDHDPGGYDRSKFYVGKFAKHVEAGALIELAAEAAHVHPAVALLGTCAGAVGFEYAQGYPNKIDMANGCAGAAASFLWHRYFGR